MTLAQIAVNNLRRRKAKMAFMLTGLVIGIATTVSIYSIVETMKAEMAGQMASYGANIVITADTGEVAFSYGGISIPEVLFDVQKLTISDITAINSLPDRQMIRVLIPRLLGVTKINGQEIVIAGSDLKSDFAVKPWLRIRNMLAPESTQAIDDSGTGMAVDKLDLSREDFENLNIGEAEVILGAGVSYKLSRFPGDRVIMNGKEYRVAAILQKNGTSEDNQILMNLQESQDLLGLPGEISVIELSADYNLGSEQTLLSQLQTTLPHAKITSLRKVMLDRDELVTRLARFGTALSILVLLAGLLVAALTMSGAVRARTREIGILRAIGFRRKHITRIILLEGIVVSVLGGLIGYVLGIIIAQFAGPALADAALIVPWRLDMLLISIVLSLVIGCLASIYPAWQASRLDPVEALRYL